MTPETPPPVSQDRPETFTPEEMNQAAAYIESYYGLTGMASIARMLRFAASLPREDERRRTLTALERFTIRDGLMTSGNVVGEWREWTPHDVLSVCLASDVERLEGENKRLRLALEQPERDRLHALLADVLGLIDPDTHGELVDRINAVLQPCDDAGTCVPAQAETCEWKPIRQGVYRLTGCGVDTKRPVTEMTKFCCYCGNKLREVPFNG